MLAAVEIRQHEPNIHQMRAAEIGIVDDVDVAGFGFARAALANEAHKIRSGMLHRANEHRQAKLALCNQSSGVPIIDAVSTIVGFGNNR